MGSTDSSGIRLASAADSGGVNEVFRPRYALVKCIANQICRQPVFPQSAEYLKILPPNACKAFVSGAAGAHFDKNFGKIARLYA